MDNCDFGLSTKDDLATNLSFNNETLQAENNTESFTPASLNYFVLTDLKEYLDETKNPNVFLEVINTYQEETKEKLAELEQSIKLFDIERLQIIAHSLKGSSATFGAMKFASLCCELEQLSKQKLTKESKLDNIFKHLKSEFEKISNLLVLYAFTEN